MSSIHVDISDDIISILMGTFSSFLSACILNGQSVTVRLIG